VLMFHCILLCIIDSIELLRFGLFLTQPNDGCWLLRRRSDTLFSTVYPRGAKVLAARDES
jgi:hypothetical protein